MAKIRVQETDVTVVRIKDNDYISLTDIAKYKSEEPSIVVANWMRNRNTIEYLGIWESLYNPDFKPIEFDRFKKEAGLNAFTLSPSKWIDATSAIGIITKSGRYGGTFAHKDIAFKFASWISVEFELYIVKEFQRLKEQEQDQLGWSAKRELSKINYHIHTDAVKHNLIPDELTPQQISIVYANEADVLNVALFGVTARQWRDANSDLKGNIRDYATINELICLSNMENINAVFINEGMIQKDRLLKLNQIAIQQMRILQEVENRKLLK
ncbi:KilA-N domain-containing protein [Dysgonomonas sp. ZJ709]|uniref:KilA-N domain-containing protein n=1 Tax=Dysgonomonas sp. ZJ709 TaxID=2709797 RepID=UPI0013EC37A4|nr:KilA-N domain-containing protein [Dysgonomonas sp. ZJ709]